MVQRTQPGHEGTRWSRELTDERGRPTGVWQAGVWVRDRDGRRRVVRVRGPGAVAAGQALDRRLRGRVGLGASGISPDMTVLELAEYWMQWRIDEAEVPVSGQPRGGQGGPVSPQTLAGYQAAIARIIGPQLGGLLINEAKPGLLDEAMRAVACEGRSTGVAHTTLTQMFALAVRHGAVEHNPMREVARPRRRRRPVARLRIPQAQVLLDTVDAYSTGRAVDREGRPAGGRRRGTEVRDLVLFLLATGCRIGEALAITWRDLDLVAEPPTAHVAATLVEPRKQVATADSRGNVLTPERVFVDKLHRQPITKTGAERTLILPDAAVAMLIERRRTRRTRRLDSPVFASASGGLLNPSNLRTRLRAIVAGTDLEGVTPHTLRRTVGTLLAHEAGRDVAREVLGHADASVTWRHYVAARDVAPDVRHVLDPVFAEPRNVRDEPQTR